VNGQILAGRYLVGEILGSGGMGAVYRGIDLRTGGPVAIKIPHPWLTADTDFTTRLHREAQIAAALVSPRIVKVIDFDWHEGRPFLVMEYVPGKTLAEMLSEQGPFSWPEAARIALEVARALDAAHRSGIVHRDLKPQNIKILEDGDVKVLDFGIARAESLPSVTAASVVVGTPQYMAPERLGGPVDDPADETVSRGDVRSDIYALGVIMHEMLTGRAPFQGDSHWAVIRAHLSAPPPPLPDTVPRPLQDVIFRCLAKRPAERYQTPAELVLALRAITATAPAATVPAVATAPPPEVQPVDTGTPTAPITAPSLAETAALPGIGPVEEVPTRANGAGAGEGVLGPGEVAAVVRPSHPGRRLPWLVVGAIFVTLLAGSGVAVAVRKGGDTGHIQAVATATTAPSPSITPTPAPTAAPVLVDDVRIYRSGADFLAGQPPVQELTTGGAVTVCYAYHGAGTGTALTLLLTAADGMPVQTPPVGPYVPTTADDIRCDTLPGAEGLAPGRYAVLVQDRGETRARQEFALVEPPPPPPPPPEPSPVAPAPVTTPVRAPTAAPAPAPRPAGGPSGTTPAPVSVAPQPPPSSSPVSVPTQPPPPTRTPLPPPSATLVPGQ
jgi:serine/threonine-protein kinase